MLQSPTASTCFVNYLDWNNRGTAQRWHMRLTFHTRFQNALNQATHFALEITSRVRSFSINISQRPLHSVNIILAGSSEI